MYDNTKNSVDDLTDAVVNLNKVWKRAAVGRARTLCLLQCSALICYLYVDFLFLPQAMVHNKARKRGQNFKLSLFVFLMLASLSLLMLEYLN